MPTLFATSQSEADRLRASKASLQKILAEFRKYPQSQWPTLFAELSLALESEVPVEIVELAPGVSVKPAEPTTDEGPPYRSEIAAAPKGNFADRAEAILKATPGGVTPAQLGAAVYGPNDERGTHKVRAVVNFLQHKRKVPIVRTSDGKWILRMPSGSNGAPPESGPLYDPHRGFPKGTVAR